MHSLEIVGSSAGSTQVCAVGAEDDGVVFNHTAEGNELGPHISFRGIDNRRCVPVNWRGSPF
jgi:hypothetical protein